MKVVRGQRPRTLWWVKMVDVKFKKLHSLFELPEQKTQGAAGFDLCYCGDEEIRVPNAAGLVIPVNLGFAMELPEGFEAQIRPRSGLALKYGITIANTPGTIDADYRGPVKALLLKTAIGKWNEETGKIDYYEELIIKPGDRVCQMIIYNLTPQIQLSFADELGDTERGEGGFGSTGVR